jgi:hypothetical protein
VAALPWQAACTRPTRCWSRCSADQSASPVTADGAAPATPTAMSVAAARSVPRNRSSRTAEVQHPSGSRTSAGCAGWPNGTPCSASVFDPAGRARTTPSDSLRMTGSSACACSTRSARAAGLRAQLVLRFRPAWRAVETEGGTSNAYPPAGQLAPSQPDTLVCLPPGRVSQGPVRQLPRLIAVTPVLSGTARGSPPVTAAEPRQLGAHDLLQLALELQQQAELLV